MHLSSVNTLLQCFDRPIVDWCIWPVT